MKTAPLHILIIEDDADTRVNLCDILELDEHRVDTAASVKEALARANWDDYGAIILDRLLPDGRAEDLLPRLKELAPDAAVLIVTGHSDLGAVITALRQGAADYILKPVNPDALRATLVRIAERRQLALAKERSEAAFRSLVESAPCMIIILRPDATIAYFSAFAEKLTGYRDDEVRGRVCPDLFLTDPAAARLCREQLPQVLTGVPARGLENAVRCKDGSLRWMVWNLERLRDHEGGPAVLAVGQDITSLKQAQEQALQAERLATIGQMVTGLAHESRNALQLIQASLEMLALEVEDRPEAMELVASIQGAEDRLHRLFEDIRGYAAPLNLERDSFNLAKVWRGAWQQIGSLRNGRHVTLHEETAGADLECSVDLFSMERVFRNIFENSLAACKDPVQIEVRCAESHTDERSGLRVAVRDNGPGLNADQRRKIFEPFFTTKRQGTGLGMAIAKRIVEAHGGAIAVGDAGPGAEIVLTLPRGPK